MYKNEGYIAGANLGHWISQYGNKSHEHFKSYIQEKDIARMASWGMDHVRVPVDYFIFESDSNPGTYLESGLVYIDNCLGWCKKNGMNMVLDLHHAPGFFFGDGDKNCLMEDAAYAYFSSSMGNNNCTISPSSGITYQPVWLSML